MSEDNHYFSVDRLMPYTIASAWHRIELTVTNAERVQQLALVDECIDPPGNGSHLATVLATQGLRSRNEAHRLINRDGSISSLTCGKR